MMCGGGAGMETVVVIQSVEADRVDGFEAGSREAAR